MWQDVLKGAWRSFPENERNYKKLQAVLNDKDVHANVDFMFFILKK